MILTRSFAIGLFAGAGLLVSACDVIIGIEELETPTASQCETPADCPQVGNPCYIRACTAGGFCEVRERDPGTVTDHQTEGDCSVEVCSQGGLPIEQADDEDVPPEPNPCLSRSCSEGMEVAGYQPERTPCEETRMCDGAGNCVGCLTNADCSALQTCSPAGECTAASCMNDMQDGDETDEDCGGSCAQKCAVGQGCMSGDDCESDSCNTSGGTPVCAAPSCEDSVKNGAETGRDCDGETQCDRCPNDESCFEDSDCESGYCSLVVNANTCQTPSCDDGTQNGTETSTDCGPDCVATCPAGAACVIDLQCKSGYCNLQTLICEEKAEM